MKNKPAFTVAIAIAFTLAIHSGTLAQQKPGGDSASTNAEATSSPSIAPAKPERALPFHGMISAVNQEANTFTITGKEKSRVFAVTEKTAFTKAGNTATMKDVVANEEVRGSYWKRTDGSFEAKTVKLGSESDAEKAAPKSKSRKKKADTSAPSPSPQS